jgi:hypothetical protein
MRGAFSRRRLLIGAAVFGTVVSTSGALWVSKADAKTALLNYFERVLPGVTIDKKSALACIDDFLAQWVNPYDATVERRSGYALMFFNLKVRAAAAASQVVGIEKLSEFSEKFELIARRALTFFLVNSNFFLISDPRQQPIVYVASAVGAACNNPFANPEPLPTVLSIGTASRNP